MPRAKSNGIELEYETFGDPEAPPLLLVMGLGTQLVGWDQELCERLAGRGFFVVRYDNRDVGLSTKIEAEGQRRIVELLAAAFVGEQVDAPYLLDDMADDAFGLLDHLGIDAAHVVGASMGGMIAQTMAIARPERVLTLTSIMSTTGDRSVGQATADAMALLLRPAASERAEVVRAGVESLRALHGRFPFDEARARRRVETSFDRCHHPVGAGRQLVAILASGDRTPALEQLEVPTLVIHGDADPLVDHSGGEATAKAVPGAELLTIEGMGHSLPVEVWDTVVDAVTGHAAKAA